jgi:hypothetical protein
LKACGELLGGSGAETKMCHPKPIEEIVEATIFIWFCLAEIVKDVVDVLGRLDGKFGFGLASQEGCGSSRDSGLPGRLPGAMFFRFSVASRCILVRPA